MPNTPESNLNTAMIGWDFTHSGVGANFPAVKLTANYARALHIVSAFDAVSGAVYIDLDGSTASRISGLKIDVDNTGTNGLVCGIDLSSFSADEPLLKVPVDTNATAGTLSGQFPVRMNTTTFYVNLYTHG